MKRIKYILIFTVACALSACTNSSFLSDSPEIVSTITKTDNLETVEVALETAGTLAEKLGDKIGTTQKLIVSGPVDASDVNTFRNNMPNLVSLDIKGVEFVESDKTYDTPWGGRKVAKNKIGEYMLCRTNLAQVVIPENITVIRRAAFGESPLESIDLPQSITKIESNAFGNTKLSGITIPQNVTSIASESFAICGLLESVSLPEGLTSIGDGAFSRCTSLRHIDIPKTVNKIGNGAFANSALQSATIPEGVTTIDCFDGCGSLKEVHLPSSLKEITGACFRKCTSLQSIEIPETVTNIGQAFEDCTSLQSITLPDNIKELGNYVFARCTALKSIKLPAKLETIAGEAFTRCSSLQYVDIPASVQIIGRGAFDGNTSLYAMFLRGKTTLAETFTGPVNTLIYLSDADANISTSIKNLIIDGVASSLTLTDKMTFFCPQEFKAQKITYTKSFNNSRAEYPIPGQSAGWVGLSLPFDVTHIVHKDGRVLAPFNANETNAKPFWLRKLTANGFENVTAIEAGVPYIIAMPHNEKYAAEYNIEGDVTFSAQDVTNGITIPVTTYNKAEGPLFDFNPSYGALPKGPSIYVLNTYDYVADRNYGSVFVRSLRNSNPFEAYVTDKAISSQTPGMYSINGNSQTRSVHVIGNVPSIDDM